MIYGPDNFYDDGHVLKRRGLVRKAPQHFDVPAALPMPKTRAEAILTLRDLIGTNVKTSLAAIKTAINVYFQLPENYLISARRESLIMRARLIYYWLARDLTTASFPTIGHACGMRDHSTVQSGVKKVAKLYPQFQTDIDAIKKMLAKT